MPVTLKEYLALMDALSKDVIDLKIDDFYFLSRTVLVKDQVAYLQVGAGIVADSVPAREQAECEAKARGIVVALERAAEMEKV